MVLVHCILQQKSSKTPFSWTGWSMIEGTTSAFLISLALIRFQVKSNCQRFLVYSVAQSCPTLCDPTDCSPPDSPLHGIFQARILEWVAISSSRRSSWPKIETVSPAVPALASGLFTDEPLGKPQLLEIEFN